MTSISGSKMLDLQLQMRQNNEELKSFMQDLDTWESDIKTKDEALKSQKIEKETVLPPVRNSLEKKKKKKVKKKDAESRKPKRISSYDYRSWDRFDVDKALEEVEEPLEGSSSDYETDEEWEINRKVQAAIIEKDKGNDYFKKGDYDNAIECYTRGLDLDPTNPLLPANRAMALLKQEKFGGAELDCTSALSLDPLYTKAYLRRGSARMGLQKYAGAKEDYERVLSLEPQNKKAKSDLLLIEKELSKENLVTQTDTESVKDIGLVKAISKSQEQKSKKPLMHIELEEIGLDDEQERKSAISRIEEGQGQSKKELIDKDSKMFERFTAISPADIGSVNNNQSTRVDSYQDSHIAAQDNKQSSLTEEKTHSLSEQKFTEPNLSLKEPNIEQEHSNDRTVLNSKNRHDGASSEGDRNTQVQSSSSVSKRDSELGKITLPTTSFQFQAEYKRMKTNMKAFYYYFKEISPQDYTKLFGEFLDSDVLLRVLQVFKEYYVQNGDDYFKSMQSLSQVKRFSMTVLFLSDKEKQVLKDLITELRRCGKYEDCDITALANKYGLR